MDKIFTLEIRCKGAAFDSHHIHEEVADILKGVARSFENDQPLTPFRHLVCDSNGNVCGTVKFLYND
jgi:hypothetical protein